jgi:hypothetical protein
VAVNPTVAAAADLVALRRRQYAAAADALDACLALLDVVEEQAATRHFDTVDQFLATATDEKTRATWTAWVDRAVAKVPTEKDM